MNYKTIVLGLLQDRPDLHERLRASRTLLATLERHAEELNASHEQWKRRLSQAQPGSDPSQVASEALEIALKELENRLPNESPQAETGPTSLDGAIAFIRRHTPPA